MLGITVVIPGIIVLILVICSSSIWYGGHDVASTRLLGEPADGG